MKQIINAYYADNAKKLRGLADKILSRFGGVSDKDRDDFYSLANEVFVDAMKRYDEEQSFDGFLYACLSNRIKTEITRRNRYKRRTDRMCISVDTPVEGDEDLTIGDTLADHFDLEMEVLSKREEDYSGRMLLYLDRLSRLQREVLRLSAAGYLPGEIRQKLQINEKQYADCSAAIHSYRNVAVLLS